MIQLHIDEQVFRLPESMDEMTRAQLTFLSRLVETDAPVQEIKVKMLFFCIDARVMRMKAPGYFRVKTRNKLFALTAGQIADASRAFDYLFTEPDEKGRCFLDIRLTVNPFPVVRLLGKRFTSPAQAMTDITYDQYIYLQTYDVMKEQRPEAIFAMMGCLFRSDMKKFDPEDLNIKRMKMLPERTVILMLWFWTGSCRFVASKFPRIFNGSGSDGGTHNPYDSQQRLLDYVAKADPQKKQAYKRDLLYNVLYSLDYMLETSEKKENHD